MGRHRHVVNVRADGIAVVLGPLLRDVRIVAAALVDVDSGMVLDAWSAAGAGDRAPDLELIGAQHAEIVRTALALLRTWPAAGGAPGTCEVVLGADGGARHLLRTVPDPLGDRLALAVVVNGPQRVLDRVRKRLQAVSVDALTAGPSMTRRPPAADGRSTPPGPDVPAHPEPGAGLVPTGSGSRPSAGAGRPVRTGRPGLPAPRAVAAARSGGCRDRVAGAGRHAAAVAPPVAAPRTSRPGGTGPSVTPVRPVRAAAVRLGRHPADRRSRGPRPPAAGSAATGRPPLDGRPGRRRRPRHCRRPPHPAPHGPDGRRATGAPGTRRPRGASRHRGVRLRRRPPGGPRVRARPRPASAPVRVPAGTTAGAAVREAGLPTNGPSAVVVVRDAGRPAARPRLGAGRRRRGRAGRAPTPTTAAA